MLVNGVLGWGMTTGIMWTISMYGLEGLSMANMAFTLPIFAAGGAVVGLIMWRLTAPTAQLADPTSQVETPSNQSEFKVRGTLFLSMGVAFIAMSIPSAVVVFPENPMLAIATIPLIALAFHSIVVFGGTVRATVEDIELRSIVGVFALRWDEITSIDTDAAGSPILFWAGKRHLPITSPGFWSGTDKTMMAVFISQQIRERKIPTRVNPWAGWKIPWAVRVRRK